jgi:AcrR family transcriptional regulator
MSVHRPSARDPESLSPAAEHRREEILDVALELFSRHGFHETSIAHIAAKAHVSRATVYQYFHDKRDVLMALAQRVEIEMLDSINSWKALPDPPGDGTSDPQRLAYQLRVMIDTRIAQFVEAATAQNVASTRLVLRSIRGHNDPIRDATRRIERHVVDIITRDVDAAIHLGWARECHAETIAIFILGGIEKLVFRALDADEPEAVNRPTLIEEIGAFIFFGVVAAGLSPPDVPRLPLRRKGPTQTQT